jgi:xylulokinase/glycerol kinase
VTAGHEVIVAVDLGTSACKVVAFDPKGRRVAYGRSCYRNRLDRSGSVEQSPVTWWTAMKNAIHASGILKHPKSIAGYSVSTLRAAIIPVDRSGRPLAPAILAPDTRAAAEVKLLSDLLGEDLIYRVTGLRLSAYSSLCRILWLKNQRPEIFARTVRVLCAQDYLIERLCGRVVTDRSHASRTSALNIHTKCWDSAILQPLGLSSELFPELVDPGSVVGELSAKASETLGIPIAPVIAAGGDQMCASVGLGAVTSEQVTINHGTGSFIEKPTSTAVLDIDRRSLSSVHVLPNHWAQEFPILLTGRLIEDLVRTMRGPQADFRALVGAALRPQTGSWQDSPPLLFLPYLGGSTAPHWNSGLPAVLCGLRSCHQTPDLVRALLESIVFDLHRCVRALRVTPREITVGGQLSCLQGFGQMQADIFGIPVTRSTEAEATALGAAVIGFAALGFHSSPQVAVQEMVHLDESSRQFPRADIQSYYQTLFDCQSVLLDLMLDRSKG